MRAVFAAVLLGAASALSAASAPLGAESIALELAGEKKGSRESVRRLLWTTNEDERAVLVARFVTMAGENDEALQVGSLRALQLLGSSAASAFETVVLIGSGARGSVRSAAAQAGLAMRPAGSGLADIVRSAVMARGTEGLEVMNTLSSLKSIPREHLETVVWAMTAPSKAMRLAAIRSVPRLYPPLVKPPEALLAAGTKHSEPEERTAALEALRLLSIGSNLLSGAPSDSVAIQQTRKKFGSEREVARAECATGPAGASHVASRLTSKEPQQAVTMAGALFLCGRNAVPALVAAAGSSDADARAYALIVLKALSERRHQLSIPDLNPEVWSGIGADINMKRGLPSLERIHPGSPAEAAGLQSLDILDAVDVRPTKPMSLDEVIQRVRGPNGSTVTLTVRRFDVPAGMRVTVRRARILKEVPRPEVSLDALRRLGPHFEAAAPALRELLDSPDAAVRETAQRALDEGPYEKQRWAAIEGGPALHPSGPIYSEAVVLTKMADSDPMVRLDGILAAGRRVPSTPLIDALRRALLDPANIVAIQSRPDLFAAPTVRHAVMLSLLNLGAAARPAVPEIADAIKVGDQAMEELAFKALAKIGLGLPSSGKTPTYVYDILKRAHGPRLELLRPLASELVGPLLDRAVLGDGPAAESLVELCPEAGEVLAAALGAGSPNRRLLASKVLARAARLPASAAGPLMEALRDESAAMRLNAARAMFHLPIGFGTEVLPALEEAESDADYQVRSAAKSSRLALQRKIERDSGGAE